MEFSENKNTNDKEIQSDKKFLNIKFWLKILEGETLVKKYLLKNNLTINKLITHISINGAM